MKNKVEFSIWERFGHFVHRVEKVNPSNNPWLFLRYINVHQNKLRTHMSSGGFGHKGNEATIRLINKRFSLSYSVGNIKELSNYPVDTLYVEWMNELTKGDFHYVGEEKGSELIDKIEAQLMSFELGGSEIEFQMTQKKVIEAQSPLYDYIQIKKETAVELTEAHKGFREMYPAEVQAIPAPPVRKISVVEEELLNIIENKEVDEELRKEASSRLVAYKEKEVANQENKKRKQANDSARLALETLDRHYLNQET